MTTADLSPWMSKLLKRGGVLLLISFENSYSYSTEEQRKQQEQERKKQEAKILVRKYFFITPSSQSCTFLDITTSY